MEYYYTAYTKVLQDVTFYFVKKFITFPEFKDMSDVLESYGMHKDFNRACEIALVDDEQIRKQLLEDIQANEISAKVVHMNINKVISAAK